MNLPELFANAKGATIKHAPQILTGLAVAGTVSTVVFAVRATPHAYEALVAEQLRSGTDEPLTKKEVVKTTWAFYIPTALMGATTLACIISANSIHMRRVTALAAAYQLADKASETFHEKMLDTFGEEAVYEAKKDILQDYLNEDPIEKNPPKVPQPQAQGPELFYDSLSGRYFYHSVVGVEHAVNVVNQHLVGSTWVSLNEFYSELGLDHVRLGEDLGWVPDNLVHVDFETMLATDGRPCVVLNYLTEPKYDPYLSI
jgi:hypothetical protein